LILHEYSDTGPAPTLQDKAIDSSGVSIGLLQFFGIRSRCTSKASNASEHTSEDDIASGYEDSEDESDEDKDYTSKGKPVLESHPYIISQ
jgi:hypothetical protein